MTAAGSSGATTATSGVATSTGSAAAGTGSSASVTPSSMSLSSSPSSTVSPDSSTTDASTQSGVSTGAKDGIGVGVGSAAVVFFSVLMALFLRRRRGMWHEMRGLEAPGLKGDERSAELEGAGVKMR